MFLLASTIVSAGLLVSVAAQNDDYRTLDDRTTCEDGIGRTYVIEEAEQAVARGAEDSFWEEHEACFSVLGEVRVRAACTEEIDLPVNVAGLDDATADDWVLCRVTLMPVTSTVNLVAKAGSFLLINDDDGDFVVPHEGVTERLNDGRPAIDGWVVNNGQIAEIVLAFDVANGHGEAGEDLILTLSQTADVVIVDDRTTWEIGGE